MANNSDQFINKLRLNLTDTLDQLVPKGKKCVLLNVADYPNVGDSAITLGELAYLQQRQVELLFTSPIRTYNPAAIQKQLGDGLILFQGGGHFGDLYPAHHAFRERVIQDFPDNSVVIFPTTFKFKSNRVLQRTKRLLEAHGSVNLFVRDQVSLELANEAFDFPIHHVPDVAFAMGPLQRSAEASQRVQLLCRTDEEAQHNLPIQWQNKAVDWLNDPLDVKICQLASRLSWLTDKPGGQISRRADPLNITACNRRFRYGLELLAQGETVVTDRLHATIMSILQGIPVNMVGDKFGKLRTFYDSWLTEAPNVNWFDDFTSALSSAEKPSNLS